MIHNFKLGSFDLLSAADIKDLRIIHNPVEARELSTVANRHLNVAEEKQHSTAVSVAASQQIASVEPQFEQLSLTKRGSPALSDSVTKATNSKRTGIAGAGAGNNGVANGRELFCGSNGSPSTGMMKHSATAPISLATKMKGSSKTNKTLRSHGNNGSKMDGGGKHPPVTAANSLTTSSDLIDFSVSPGPVQNNESSVVTEKDEQGNLIRRRTNSSKHRFLSFDVC